MLVPRAEGPIPALDVWRGTAITFLLLGHFFEIPKINFGRLGVEFFFVLSGFLMGRLLFIKRTPLGHFYRRRISRIFPAGYAFLIAMVSIRPLSGYGAPPYFTEAVSCFLFYVNYFVALQPNVYLHLPFNHFWSLCVEEHTYIFLSLLAFLCRRTGWATMPLLVTGLVGSFVTAWIVGSHENWDYYRVYWRSDCRAGSILCGVVAACLASRGVGSLGKYGAFRSETLGWCCIAIGIFLNATMFHDYIKYTLGTIFLAAAILLISQHGSGWYWSFRPLVWLGTISYSVYLWQQPFFEAVHAGKIGFIPALLSAVAVGGASYYLWERPVRSYLNATWAK